MISFADDTVEVITPSQVDDRGTLVMDYDRPESVVEVKGCSVQPGASAEDIAARSHVTIRHTAFLPADAPVAYLDAIKFEGVRYSIDGAPVLWKSPTGQVSNKVVYLIDWKG